MKNDKKIQEEPTIEDTIEVMRTMPEELKNKFKDHGYDIDLLADQYEEEEKEHKSE